MCVKFFKIIIKRCLHSNKIITYFANNIKQNIFKAMYVKTEIGKVVFDVEIETSTPRLEKASITIGGETVDFTQLFCDNEIDELVLDRFYEQIKKYNEQQERESREQHEV